MILNGDLQSAKRYQHDCAYLSQTDMHIILLTLSLQGEVGENHCYVEAHMNFFLHLAGYVSDPMSTMRFHSCSSSGSFEESSWQHEPPAEGLTINSSHSICPTPRHCVLQWRVLNWTALFVDGKCPCRKFCSSIFLCWPAWGLVFLWWCASIL